MQRAAEKDHMAADRLSAGKTGDRLVDDGLENGSRKVFFCRTLIDQRLDIGLRKYAAARSNGIERLVIFCIFI